jgi:hypothetical protein
LHGVVSLLFGLTAAASQTAFEEIGMLDQRSGAGLVSGIGTAFHEIAGRLRGLHRGTARRANTQGETLDEARENLNEAVALVLQANRVLVEQSLEGAIVIRETFALPAA